MKNENFRTAGPKPILEERRADKTRHLVLLISPAGRGDGVGVGPAVDGGATGWVGAAGPGVGAGVGPEVGAWVGAGVASAGPGVVGSGAGAGFGDGVGSAEAGVGWVVVGSPVVTGG